MQAKITKDQLRALNARAGQLDTDRSLVFAQFIGSMSMGDMLYHGELHFTEPDSEQKYESFSVAEILNGDANGDIHNTRADHLRKHVGIKEQ